MRRLRQMNSNFQMFRKKLKSQRGFTLVELMAVLIITGLILAMAVPKVVGIIQGSEEDVHIASLDSIERAAEMAFLRGVPSESEEEILYSVPTLVAGGFLDVTEGTGLEDEFVVLGDIDGSSIIPPGHIGGGNGNGNGGGNGGGNGENGNNGGNGGSGGNNSGNGGNGSGSNNGGSGNGSGGNVGDNNGTGEVPERDPIPPNPVSDFEYEVVGHEVMITGHKKGLTEIKVPRTIGGLLVTSVKENAFSASSLRLDLRSNVSPVINRPPSGSPTGTRMSYSSIELPDTIVSLNSKAVSAGKTNIGGAMYSKHDAKTPFLNTLIRDMYLNEGLEDIGSYTFYGGNLEHINIPNSVKTIGRYAFSKTDLQSVNIGTGISTIELETFKDNHLTELYIPKNVKKIEAGAFQNNALEKVIFEDVNETKIKNVSVFSDNDHVQFYDINGKQIYLGTDIKYY